MTGPLPPHILASVDQHRAMLADLVAAVREHVDADVCDYAPACPGPRVAAALGELKPSTWHRLLYLAVGELAALDYGAPVHLTEAAHAVLDETKRKKWRWWPWRLR